MLGGTEEARVLWRGEEWKAAVSELFFTVRNGFELIDLKI